MAEAQTTSQISGRWRLRIAAIVWFVLFIGLLLSVPVLIDIGWWALAIVAALALLLALPGAWITRRLFSGQRRQHWRTSYFKAFFAALALVAIALAAPLYTLAMFTALRPMTVPNATLSNGSKTVVFQGMAHIGSEGFYKSVVYDLEAALADGYVLYYEGVRSAPEGDQWFSDTMAGGGDLNSNYSAISQTCGLHFQLDYFGLLQADMAAHPERHVSADVTTADMMDEYQRLMQTDPAFAAAVGDTRSPAPADGADSGGGVAGLLSMVAKFTPSQRSLVGTACRGYLTYLLGQKTAPSPLDPVILDFRNKALAERIAADTHDKIYITYGANHLPGLLQLLQENDPAWEIKSLKWLRAIDTPEQLDGTLD